MNNLIALLIFGILFLIVGCFVNSEPFMVGGVIMCWMATLTQTILNKIDQIK